MFSENNDVNKFPSDEKSLCEVMKDQDKCCCCFNSSHKRFVALLFILMSTFFYSASYDMPGSMEQVVQNTFSVLSYEFEYLYSVYSLPNIIMCFFGGLLIDKVFGLLWGPLIFGLVALAGQITITVGGFTESYSLMLFGRFFSGIGAESVSLSLCCYSVVWFRGKELSFVFGLMVSVLRLGASFAFLIFTPLYDYIQTKMSDSNALSYGISIIIFLLAAVAMVLCVTFLGIYTKYNGKLTPARKDYESTVRFRDIMEFPLIYWLLLIMLSLCNNAFYAFISISQPLLKNKYNLTDGSSNYLCGMFNIISALACPVPGLIVDRLGNDLYFNMFGIVTGIASQTIMALTQWNPLIPLIFFAIFFAVFTSCSWPLISRTVKPYQLGTAYGTLMCFFNLVGTINNILVGYILQVFGPNGVAFLFCCNLIVGAIFCSVIWILDKRSNGPLNLTGAKRRILLEND